MATTMSDQIKAAANAVAEARANAAKASDALAAAQGARKRLTDRVASIQVERSGIVSARRAGSADPEAPLKMAVLDADERDLAGLVIEADTAVKAALDNAQAAQGAVARAEQHLDMAHDEWLLAKLTEHATTLDGLLLRSVNEITAIAARSGRGPCWFPSGALATTLTKLSYTENLRK
jgi:hypothetical protein